MPRKLMLTPQSERRRCKSARNRETSEERNLRLNNCRQRMRKRRASVPGENLSRMELEKNMPRRKTLTGRKERDHHRLLQRRMRHQQSELVHQNDFRFRGFATDFVCNVKTEYCNENASSLRDLDGKHVWPSQNVITSSLQEDDVVIKEENEVYEVMIKQELDIGPTALQPNTILDLYEPSDTNNSSVQRHKMNTKIDETTASLEATTIQTATCVKVENNFHNDNNEELVEYEASLMSNVNIPNNMDENTL